MGFSRGGQATLYASLKRFQKMWNSSGIDPAAYIALYAPCITTYINDIQVSDHPIRIFHGRSDDWVDVTPCRAYFERLRRAGKDVQMTEFPNAWHAFDYPSLPTDPVVVPYAQVTHCVLKEEPLGTIIDMATHKPFTFADRCIARGAHVAYSATATAATHDALKTLLHRIANIRTIWNEAETGRIRVDVTCNNHLWPNSCFSSKIGRRTSEPLSSKPTNQTEKWYGCCERRDNKTKVGGGIKNTRKCAGQNHRDDWQNEHGLDNANALPCIEDVGNHLPSRGKQ
jgi:dienelactone hydrolase